MELRHLRYFAIAAEEKNFSRAAARLFVSQPAVSRQIKDLEEELGLELFRREPMGLELTEAGKLALGQAQVILDQSDDLRESMRHLAEQQSGKALKVGFLPTALPIFLTDALRRFRNSREFCQVQIYEMPPDQQAESLRDGAIDLALLGNPSRAVLRDFQTIPIYQSEMALFLPDEHPLAAPGSPVALDACGAETFVVLSGSDFSEQQQTSKEMFAEAGFTPGATLLANGLSELLGLVGSGAGIAVGPATLKEVSHPGVVFVPLDGPRRILTFSAAIRKGETNPDVKRFLKGIEPSGSYR